MTHERISGPNFNRSYKLMFTQEAKATFAQRSRVELIKNLIRILMLKSLNLEAFMERNSVVPSRRGGHSPCEYIF